jgi:hypothetical protein
MKKVTLSLSFLVGVIGFMSCNKNKPVTTTTTDNPLKVIQSYFANEKQDDFTVFVSSVHPVSVYENYPISRSVTSVEAFGKNGARAGVLNLNNISIPFDGSSYYLQTDTVKVTTPMLTGLDVQSHFASSTSDVPSFTGTKYSPAVTDLQFAGIVDHKLPRNNDFSISWTPDRKLASGKGLVVLMGTAEDGTTKTLTREVEDNIGKETFTSSDLAAFNTFESFSVFYGRGYYNIESYSGKTVCFQFINYSWSRIVFAK